MMRTAPTKGPPTRRGPVWQKSCAWVSGITPSHLALNALAPRCSPEHNVPSFVIDLVTNGTGWNPAVRLKGRSAKLPGGLLSYARMTATCDEESWALPRDLSHALTGRQCITGLE